MHDDLGLYVLGALEDPREFEAHLAACDECRAELAALRGTLDTLDGALLPTIAPAALKQRTMAAIRASGAPDVIAPPAVSNVVSIAAARSRRVRIVSIVAIAALAIVIAGVGIRTFTRSGFSADRSFALSDPNGGTASGEVLVDDTGSGQEIELTVAHLPDAPPGSYYECWWVGPNDSDDIQDRVSAGTFTSGNGTFRMHSSANATRFTKMGITLEPDDGNPARTGQKVLGSQPPAPTPAP